MLYFLTLECLVAIHLNTVWLENRALLIKMTQRNITVKTTGICLNFLTFFVRKVGHEMDRKVYKNGHWASIRDLADFKYFCAACSCFILCRQGRQQRRSYINNISQMSNSVPRVQREEDQVRPDCSSAPTQRPCVSDLLYLKARAGNAPS